MHTVFMHTVFMHTVFMHTVFPATNIQYPSKGLTKFFKELNSVPLGH